MREELRKELIELENEVVIDEDILIGQVKAFGKIEPGHDNRIKQQILIGKLSTKLVMKKERIKYIRSVLDYLGD